MVSRRSFHRQLVLCSVVVVLGLAATVAFRSKAVRPQPVPILGVVHQTVIRVAPETSGRLTSFQLIAGQKVHKGDVLAVLSSPELAASVQEAKATAASERADRSNIDAGVRKEEVDISAQDVRIAEANLALAQQQYARSAALASEDFASRQQLDENATTFRKGRSPSRLAPSDLCTEQGWSDQ